MMATSKKMLDQEPGEIEMLLPWHAAGTLNARDTRRVEEALARDPELAKQYAVIREEYAETIDLNESLGAPSARAMHEAVRRDRRGAVAQAVGARSISRRGSPNFSQALSPRTLAWSASVGALALLLQAGVIGAVLVKNQNAPFQTASLSMNDPATRALGPETPPRALVRFAPDARVADITALLDSYQASIVDGAKGGLFRLQFGNKAMSKDEVAGLMSKLQSEKIVSLAVATP